MGALAVGGACGSGVQAAGAHQASPAKTVHLRLADFYDTLEIADVSGKATATVAGMKYARGIELIRGFAHLSYNTHRYMGYKSLVFFVGMTDSTDAGSQNTLVLTADGRTIKTLKAQPSAPAVKVVVRLAKIHILRWSVKGGDPASSGLLILNPNLKD
jgi:hypothetical protein